MKNTTATNELFGALLLSLCAVFIGGNLVAANPQVLLHSATITLACILVITLFYSLSRISGSMAWGLVICYILLYIMAFSYFEWRREVGLFVGVGSCIYTLVHLRFRQQQYMKLVLGALMAAVCILATRSAVTSFDMMPRAYVGELNHDTLFHSSIAAMIKNYGVVSTGLHGLVETPYHTLSHTLMAAISVLSGNSVLEVYGVATWVLFCPILLLAISACVVWLDDNDTADIARIWAICSVLLAIIPLLFSAWALWDSFFISESYLVSLGIFSLALPVLFSRSISWADVLLVCLLCLLMSHAKATVGLIYAGLWLTRLLFLRSDRLLLDTMAFVLATLAAWLAVRGSAQAHATDLIWQPFHFLYYARNGAVVVDVAKSLASGMATSYLDMAVALVVYLIFVAIHFMMSWWVVIPVIRNQGVLAVFRSPVALYSLAATGAGLLAIVFLAIPDGSLYYATNVNFFVALPAVILGVYRYAGARKQNTVPLLLAGLIFLVVINSQELKRDGQAAEAIRNKEKSALITALMDMRGNTDKAIVYRYKNSGMIENPISVCFGQPFVFTSVSESPWTEVIVQGNGCKYKHYGYEQYGFSEGQQKVNISVKLLNGMKVSDYYIGEKIFPKPE